jgi:hypothetical protein
MGAPTAVQPMSMLKIEASTAIQPMSLLKI